MKRVLVICYSQSGDVRNVAKSFVEPLEGMGVDVVWYEVEPTVEYPSPWRNVHRFFNVMPECVLDLPPDVAPPGFSPDEEYDLIVLAYQVWFLSPSLPIQGFFQTDHVRALRGRKVITLSVSRNMWHRAHLKMRELLAQAGAVHIDNVVVTHQGAPWATFITTPRTLFTGKRDAFLGLPPAGIADSEPDRMKLLGTAVADQLDSLDESGERSLLRSRGAVEVNRRYIIPELVASLFFPFWAHVIRGFGWIGRPLRHVGIFLFFHFLMLMILLGIPMTIITLPLVYPFVRKSMARRVVPLKNPRRPDVAAYMNGAGVFLPNKPVHNEKIESVLGMIGETVSPLRDVVLERNGIKWRYYAIDPVTRDVTHSNAELTVAAIQAMMQTSGLSVGDIDLLACGTSSPDQAIPSHASMVHGLLGGKPCECISTSGVCCSGMAALKYAYLAVAANSAQRAVVTGSELVSMALRSSQFNAPQDENVAPDPYLGFSREFLRFMLSDGAGALLIEDRPRPGQLALKIEWLDMQSYANELDACMYSGAVKQEDGTLRSWRTEEQDPAEAAKKGYFNLFQDVSLLSENIVPTAGKFFADVLERRGLTPADVDWLLPHISSMFFQQPLYEEMAKIGFDFPAEKWFMNLKYKGNTGAASIFIMLEELYRSGKLKPGDHILCAVPESARFTFACLYLTVE